MTSNSIQDYLPDQVTQSPEFTVSIEQLISNHHHIYREIKAAYTQIISFLSCTELARLRFDLVRFPIDYSLPELGIKRIEYDAGPVSIMIWFKFTSGSNINDTSMTFLDGKTVTLVDCCLWSNL